MDLPFTPELPLRTDRLVLRAFAADDLDALFAIHADPVAVRYVPYPPRTREQTAEVLQRKIGNSTLRQEGGLLELAAVRATDQALIGDLLLALRSLPHQTVEVGYIFAPAAGGQGYATEAVRALVDLTFARLGARRLVARLDDRNHPSAALLERLGFRREAHLIENEWFKGKLSSQLDYALLSREWPGLS